MLNCSEISDLAVEFRVKENISLENNVINSFDGLGRYKVKLTHSV
jgi:hypothetical protein